MKRLKEKSNEISRSSSSLVKEIDWNEAVRDRIAEINSPEIPPRAFEPKDDGNKKDGKFVPNGNKILGTYCSYCDQKKKCYPELRTFIYSSGPKFFVSIKEGKEPKVPEIK